MDLYLIDGNSYVYRAFYAIKGLSTAKGIPTNAIYGFTTMLLKIIKGRQPGGIAVAFDSPAPTERHRLFAAYKAQRPETPEDLARQLPHIRRMVSAFDIKTLVLPGFEADDLLATIAVKAAKEGANVFIVTSDKDMLQVVGDRIRIYDPVKDRVLDAGYVVEKFGLPPERVPEFMALTGDSVDNIPGIKGIGEKTARELLTDFKDLEDLLNHPDRIKKEKLRNLVIENAESARLSKRLAMLDTSVPTEVDLQDFTVRTPDWAALLALFREFEFGTLMKLIPSTERNHSHEVLYSRDRVSEVSSAFDEEFAFDVETTGNNALTDTIVGMSLSDDGQRAYYIPFGHSYPGAPLQPDRSEVFSIISALFEDPGRPKTGHNLKYDIAVLRREGMAVKGTLYDTMIASYLLNPNRPNHSLGDIAFEYLSYRKKTFQEILGKRSSFAEVPVEDAAAYCAEDASLAFELRKVLFGKLREEDLEKVYFTLEMPLIEVLIDMEEAGFRIDIGRFSAMSEELGREIESVQKRIYFLAGAEFNINSPKQLSTILFHSLGLKPGKKTKTGFSTELSVLEELAESHELPKEILDYRSLTKLKSTYTDVLPRLVNPRTGRIHTSFNQTVTATGRLSSSDPNLQNIPVRGEWGRRIREAFVAEKGTLLISADYAQIELRILACLSGDKGLLDAFLSGVDIHARTASEIFGVPIGNVTTEMRRVAKTVNFGIVYGISPFGLSEALGIPAESARKFIAGYFEGHPGVRAYIDRALADARQKGYVTTMFGRRRAIPELKSSNATTRALGERLAVNSPIQGTAADVIKIAMIALSQHLKKEGLRTRLILQVHDELVLESPADELARAEVLIRERMEGAADLAVPLVVETGHGSNWAEAHG